MATARPMPLSPPVITATLSVSLPEPRYDFSPQSGTGSILDWTPGTSCCCAGWLMSGLLGWCLVGCAPGAYPRPGPPCPQGLRAMGENLSMPVGRRTADLLGEPYGVETIELEGDDEGAVVASLVSRP